MDKTLSLAGRRWILRHSQPLAGGDILTMLRSERGISDQRGAKLSDPFLFPEMEKAVRRIKSAMENKETIGIFGDYDADGITGTAQLVRYFRRQGIEPVTYLPNRLTEGYGMKKESIDLLKEKNVTLLITVDTGISAHAEIAHASSLGIDTIVTDHHLAARGRPPACAVIHPTVPSAFPNPHLCGSGVAFMLVRALEGGEIWEGVENDVVLAMIGTIGDVMPLTGENRILVIHGLKLTPKLPPCPLKDLIDDVTNGKPVTSGDIAFRVVPRINAAGRMRHPGLALSALLDGGEALQSLHTLNGDRQLATADAMSIVRPLLDLSQSFLCIASPHVTSGIVGLIAGRITEEFGRPSLVASISNNICTASLRSVDSVDLMECLSHPSVCPLLLSFGGHRQAAGCTFQVADISLLQTALSAVLTELGHTIQTLLPETSIDLELPKTLASLAIAKSLQALAPFGQDNKEPLFLMRNLRIQSIRPIGADNAHLQLAFPEGRAIAFGFGKHAEHLAAHDTIDAVCSLSVNAWNGRESLQLVVKDIRKSYEL